MLRGIFSFHVHAPMKTSNAVCIKYVLSFESCKIPYYTLSQVFGHVNDNCPKNCIKQSNVIERFHLQFCKRHLGVKKEPLKTILFMESLEQQI